MSATDGSEMDGYEALVSELRANPPVAPERLRQRVLGGAPASRAAAVEEGGSSCSSSCRSRSCSQSAAAFVHGFVSSGSKPLGA